MTYLKVKNFDKFQHYTNRTPPWIKLHRDILKDYGFSNLPDVSKGHLMLLWVLASQLDNRIPDDPNWIAGQLGTNTPIDLDRLKSLGFLIEINELKEEEGDASNLLATCYQSKQNAPRSVSVSVSSSPISSLLLMHGFEKFWDAYPNKSNRKKAEAAWLKYKLATKADQIVQDVHARAAGHSAWIRGYIPNPENYLKDERWNDPITDDRRDDHEDHRGLSAPERVRRANAKYITPSE